MRDLRERLNKYIQGQVVRVSGLSESTVQMVAAGKVDPKLSTAIILYDAMDIIDKNPDRCYLRRGVKKGG